MFYLIEKMSKTESKVLAMHHDFGAINDLSLAYQTIGRYEYEIVSNDFNFEEPEENVEEVSDEVGSEVNDTSVEEPPKPLDPNSYQAFKLKTAYCDAEVKFLIDCFCSSFTVADVADMLNQCLSERFPKKQNEPTILSTDDIDTLSAVNIKNEDD